MITITLNAWIYLALAIACELIATTCLKLSNGFVHWHYGLIGVLGFSCALYFLALAVTTLEIGIAYAIWSGVGIAVITIVCIIFFSESIAAKKLFFLAMIIIGVIGLQWVAKDTAASVTTSEAES